MLPPHHLSKCSLPLPSHHENKIDRMVPLPRCLACSESYSRSTRTRTQIVLPLLTRTHLCDFRNAICELVRFLLFLTGDRSRASQPWLKKCASLFYLWPWKKDDLSWRARRGPRVRFLPDPFPPRTKLNALPQRTDPGCPRFERAPIPRLSKRHQRSGAHPSPAAGDHSHAWCSV